MNMFDKLWGGCCLDSILLADPVTHEVYCGACYRKVSRKKARRFAYAWKKVAQFLAKKKEKKTA